MSETTSDSTPRSHRWALYLGGGATLLILGAGAAAIARDRDEPRADSCDEAAALAGDVDGDGTDDQVAHVLTDAGPVLRACTSASGDQEIEGLGTASFLDLADIQDDGTMEVFYGSQDGDVRNVQVAVIADGALQPVIFENTTDMGIPFDGEPLPLQHGHPDGRTPEGPSLAYGCETWTTGEHFVTTAQVELHGTELADGFSNGNSAYSVTGEIAHVAHDANDYYLNDGALGGDGFATPRPADRAELADWIADSSTSPC
jgi:hypothetical protein